MKSKTKYLLTNEEIRNIFINYNKSEIDEIQMLSNGEFNSVYLVFVAEKKYVLKVGVNSQVEVMPHEKDMIKSEIYWYQQIKERTNINTPDIYFYDYSKSIIDADYFIMSFVEGHELNLENMDEKTKKDAIENKIRIVTSMHKIKTTKFGYIADELFDTWYDAIKNIVFNVKITCNKIGISDLNAKKLLKYIDDNKKVLQSVAGTAIFYDLWDPNIIVNDGKYYVIDPERCFYGDPICDFIAIMFTKDLEEGRDIVELYNLHSEEKVYIDINTEIRYKVGLGYLALIMEVEKYFRYEENHELYKRNDSISKWIFSMI